MGENGKAVGEHYPVEFDAIAMQALDDLQVFGADADAERFARIAQLGECSVGI